MSTRVTRRALARYNSTRLLIAKVDIFIRISSDRASAAASNMRLCARKYAARRPARNRALVDESNRSRRVQSRLERRRSYNVSSKRPRELGERVSAGSIISPVIYSAVLYVCSCAIKTSQPLHHVAPRKARACLVKIENKENEPRERHNRDKQHARVFFCGSERRHSYFCARAHLVTR